MTGPEDQIRLDGQVALVTGANSPIGVAIAQKLASFGARVVLGVNREVSRANDLASELNSPMVVADLTDPSSAKRMIDNTIELFGQLDVLVNNAAKQTTEPLATTTVQVWDEILNTNLRAVHLLMQTSIEALSKSNNGTVVNVASVEAHQPAADHGSYATSKAGLIMLTRAAAIEYGSLGIRVNSVSPGLIDDGTLSSRWPDGVDRWLAKVPIGRIGTPEDVANAVTFLASPMARWVSGADLVVDGGILSLPTW